MSTRVTRDQTLVLLVVSALVGAGAGGHIALDSGDWRLGAALGVLGGLGTLCCFGMFAEVMAEREAFRDRGW